MKHLHLKLPWCWSISTFIVCFDTCHLFPGLLFIAFTFFALWHWSSIRMGLPCNNVLTILASPRFDNVLQTVLLHPLHLGEHPEKFSVKVGILTPSPNVGIPQKEKKCLFCILGYSKHIIFSWKSPVFLVIGNFLCDFQWFFWLGRRIWGSNTLMNW